MPAALFLIVLSPFQALRVDGARVFREGVELACTHPEGTGEIRAFDRHPGGTVFFAAENGLFNLSPEVEHLDHVQRMDGAPQGPLVGVVVEGHDRLWLATPEALGCVDSRLYFGRTFGEAEGLPAPPYRGLRRAKDGGLWLATAAGVHHLALGRGERPTLRLVEVEGRPFEPGQRYRVAAQGRVRFRLEGEGTGELTYRYRLRHHHLLLPLDPAQPCVEGLEPGDHEVLVSVWDRELRKSVEVVLPVRVAYPQAFDKRTLLPLAIGTGVLLLGAWLLRSRSQGGGAERYARAFLSAFLTMALGLQLLVGFVPHGRSWPFVGFTMYLERYEEGSLTYKMTLRLFRQGRDGEALVPYDAGYGLYEFRRTLAEVIHGDPVERQRYLERLQARYGGDIVGYAALDERRRLTPRGPVPVASTVMCVWPPEAPLASAR